MVDYRGKTVEGLLTWADDTHCDPASVGLCELLFGLAKGKVDEELVAGTPCTCRAPITACAMRR